MGFCKYKDMDKTLPIFRVHAKRRNVDEQSTHIYLRIIYQTDIIDRNTGVLCLYDQWQVKTFPSGKIQFLRTNSGSMQEL